MKNKKVEDLSLLTTVLKSGITWKQFEVEMADVYFDMIKEGNKDGIKR